jgi:hypothetical protein
VARRTLFVTGSGANGPVVVNGDEFVQTLPTKWT